MADATRPVGADQMRVSRCDRSCQLSLLLLVIIRTHPLSPRVLSSPDGRIGSAAAAGTSYSEADPAR